MAPSSASTHSSPPCAKTLQTQSRSCAQGDTASPKATLTPRKSGWQRPDAFAAQTTLRRAYHDQKRAEGQRHSQALIALARRRSGVFFAIGLPASGM
jgi:hypothetical protein